MTQQDLVQWMEKAECHKSIQTWAHNIALLDCYFGSLGVWNTSETSLCQPITHLCRWMETSPSPDHLLKDVQSEQEREIDSELARCRLHTKQLLAVKGQSWEFFTVSDTACACSETPYKEKRFKVFVAHTETSSWSYNIRNLSSMCLYWKHGSNCSDLGKNVNVANITVAPAAAGDDVDGQEQASKNKSQCWLVFRALAVGIV